MDGHLSRVISTQQARGMRAGTKKGMGPISCPLSPLMAELMQDWPLVTSTILRHAALHHGTQQVVSFGFEGRTALTYKEIYARCVRLALALARLGCKPGDVIATCAWNTHRHLEAWCADCADCRVQRFGAS